MALEVPQRIHERLIAIIDDLRNAVGQEVARAFLVSLINVELVEPEVASCNDSWIEFINKDFINNASKFLQSTPLSSFDKIEDLFLQTIDLQTEADTSCSALSSTTANSLSLIRSIMSESFELC